MAGNVSGTEPSPTHAQTTVEPAASSAESVSVAAAAQASSENFPVALRILPARYRRHLMPLYGFAGLTDDSGDEVSPAERLRLLDELEADVDRIYDGGTPRLAAMRELRITVAECAVPAQPLRDLIQANRQDQLVTRYETIDDLVGYCRLSADPIGRVVLHIFGAATPERERLSDSICTALQLAEHWQDVAEDLGKGRIYLPRADRDKFGVTEPDLAAALLDEGAPLVGTLRGAARLAVAGYLAGGRAALAAITAADYDVLAVTPHPDKRVTARLAVQAYLRGR